MKLTTLIAAAALALAPLGAQARVSVEQDADSWYDSCNTNLVWHNSDSCYAYVRGIADSLKALNSNVACIPDNVGLEELTDVGREYVDACALKLHAHGLKDLSAAALIVKSFAKKWPCAEERDASRVQLAQNQTRFYDARGNSVGTATRDSQGTTTFRDSRDRTIGRSSK